MLAYLLVPEVLPLPIEPELGVFVVPLEEPVLGDVVLGEVVLLPLPMLPEELPLEPDELPPALEPELKCASHSVREICPSLLVSTAEKLWVVLPLVLAEPPAAPVADEPVDELPLVADGVEEELSDDLALSSAAVAARDKAKSAAAVVTVTVLSIGRLL